MMVRPEPSGRGEAQNQHQENDLGKPQRNLLGQETILSLSMIVRCVSYRFHKRDLV